MTKKILIIDDIRSDFDVLPGMKAEGSNLLYAALEDNVPRDNIVIVRSYDMGILMLQHFTWDILYLDHDLGGEKTGYDIIKFIEEMVHTGYYQVSPNDIVCVSANPSGKKRIEEGWAQIVKKLEEIKSYPNHNKGYPE